jgi:hypothetical protein
VPIKIPPRFDPELWHLLIDAPKDRRSPLWELLRAAYLRPGHVETHVSLVCFEA